MIGNVIQEYLVSLGFHVDKPGFNAMNQTINTTTNVVEQATGRWSKSFLAASGIVTTSLAGITSALVGVAKAAATEDLQMQKLGRNMMIGKDAAWSMKKATDALGESMTDIMLTPELAERFHKLVEDGNRMKVGGDFSETMKGFRELMFQFTRLKQEVSYAMTWVGYYIMKYLSRPLAEAEAKFRNFNDKFVANMSVWTEKAARAAVYIINIGLHFIQFLGRLKKELGDMWNSFPRGVRIAIAAVAILSSVIKASPLGRMIQLVSILLLLIDDYFGYFEGKDALLGKYWEKLDKVLNRAKQGIMDLGQAAEPVLETAQDWLEKGVKSAEKFGNKLLDIGGRIGGSNSVQQLGQSIKNLAGAFADFSVDAAKSALDIIERFLKACEKYGLTEQLYKAVDNLADSFKILTDSTADALRWLDDLLKDLAESDEVNDFIDAVGEMVSVFADLINTIWKMVNIVLREFFNGMDDTGHIYGFRDALKLVVKVAAGMIRAFSWIIKLLTKLFKMMADSRIFQEFWNNLGKAVRNFGKIFDDVIGSAINKMGRFGRAMKKLLSGDIKGALREIAGGNGYGKTRGLTDDERQYDELIQKYSKEFGVDPNFVRAIMKKESSFNANAVSYAGAQGLMQLMPGTASQMGVTDPFNPEDNIRGGVKYIRWIMDNYHPADLETLAKMYNAGPGAPEDAEKGYASDVMQYYNDYVSRTSYDSGYGASGNRVTQEANSYAEGDKFINPELTDDASRSCASWASTVYSGAGIDGLWGASVDNLEAAFRQHNAWHGGDYDPQPGDYIQGVGGTERTTGHAGIYLGNGKVRSRDSDGGVKTWDLDDWKTTFGFDGYGSLAEYLQYSDAGGGGMPGMGFVSSMAEKAAGLQQRLDPAMLTAMRYGMGPNSGFGGAGTTIIQNTVSVGGVNVAGTKASADEIGSAVGQKTIEALTRRGQYLVRNRAMTGGPILT